MKLYPAWLYLVWLLAWFAFYTVRLNEGHFGKWSEITFCIAFGGPGILYEAGRMTPKFVRSRKASRTQKT